MQTDILMAAALGDAALVRKHLDADPGSIRMDVSMRWFPMRDPRAGGSIYIWKLGRYRTAHTVARDFGHEDIFQLLLERTPDDLKLALACEFGDEAAFREMMTRRPGLAESLSKEDQQKLPDAAQNNNTNAVRLMLEAGWPVSARGEMGATALHWAGWNGNVEMTRVILKHHPELELQSTEYASPALGWALFGSENSWHRETGDYAGTVRALLEAGAAAPSGEGLDASEVALAALLGEEKTT